MSRIIFVAGFVLLLVVFAGCGNSELDDILKRGVERDVIAELPLEVTGLSADWTDKSAADASGQFTVKMKTTEALYESIANEDALQQLGITSAEADEILFPGDMNVTGNVIDEKEHRFISLSANGDADSIGKLRVSRNYQALEVNSKGSWDSFVCGLVGQWMTSYTFCKSDF